MRILFLSAALLAFNAAHAAGDAGKGKTAFVKHGCYECHGFMGQGGMSGKTLAPNPLPFETFSAFVRKSNGPMPPFQKAILSDDDLADIYAYLHSIKARDYKTIPLLNQ